MSALLPLSVGFVGGLLAESLGLAVGSIGFIRRRCLIRLQRALARHGLR